MSGMKCLWIALGGYRDTSPVNTTSPASLCTSFWSYRGPLCCFRKKVCSFCPNLYCMVGSDGTKVRNTRRCFYTILAQIWYLKKNQKMHQQKNVINFEKFQNCQKKSKKCKKKKKQKNPKNI